MGYYVLVSVFGLADVFALWKTLTSWTKPPSEWVTNWVTGRLRKLQSAGLPLFLSGLIMVTVAYVIGPSADTGPSNGWRAVAVSILGWCLIVLWALAAAIYVTGKPKALIPPSLRSR